MIQKIKNKLLILASVFMVMLPAAAAGSTMTLVSGTAFAAANCSSDQPGNTGQDCIQGGLCSGAQDLSVSTSGGTTQCQEASNGGISSIVKTVVNILSIIVGVVAVIMIIVAGLRYVTSGGKQESVTGAKNTILYAVIGLVIVALAQIIVRFVLTHTTSGT